MPNIRFNYLYRDGANYKQFGFVTFQNDHEISIEEATAKIYPKLISNEFFVPQDWGLPRLHFHPYDPEIDHEWHEFESFEFTKDQATDGREIGEFLEIIVKGYDG